MRVRANAARRRKARERGTGGDESLRASRKIKVTRAQSFFVFVFFFTEGTNRFSTLLRQTLLYPVITEQQSTIISNVFVRLNPKTIGK